jgi:hypothetical protein
MPELVIDIGGRLLQIEESYANSFTEVLPPKETQSLAPPLGVGPAFVGIWPREFARTGDAPACHVI